MKDCMINATQRLSRIEGHVRGVKRMIDEDKPCEDVLIQLAAVEAACRKVSQLILENHIEHCMKEAIELGTQTEALDSLKAALKHFV